ncbi:MAG: 1-acyl-sn-glycerol-3-phosphate acyltransferase [Chloroflexota bacterium]
MQQTFADWYFHYIHAPIYVFVVERVLGWRINGDMHPEERKFILVTEPHTSNFDIMIVFYWGCKIRRRIRFVIKKETKDWFIVGPILRLSGAIFIDRDAPMSALKTILKEARAAEDFILMISPKGTRKYADGWKAGFYYIAQKTGMPLKPGGADFARKLAMLAPMVYPTGDIEADIETMRPFFESITAKHPELTAPVRLLRDESEKVAV